jgi:hypothetical protein
MCGCGGGVGGGSGQAGRSGSHYNAHRGVLVLVVVVEAWKEGIVRWMSSLLLVARLCWALPLFFVNIPTRISTHKDAGGEGV